MPRSWRGENGDTVALIVWPDRGLIHLMRVADEVTFCGCGAMGPWEYFGALVGDRLVDYTAYFGPPADMSFCPGCFERLGMLSSIRVQSVHSAAPLADYKAP